MKFEISDDSEHLSIQQTLSSWMALGKEALGLIMSLWIVLIFPYDQLIAISKFLWLIYFIPIFPLIRFIKSLVTMGNGVVFELDKRSNGLIKNGKVIDQLSNIKHVEWNIDSATDHEESYLELCSITNKKLRISTTANFMNKEHLELGKKLARFLKTEFHNNNPLEKEILFYGQNDVNENDLNFIENR